VEAIAIVTVIRTKLSFTIGATELVFGIVKDISEGLGEVRKRTANWAVVVVVAVPLLHSSVAHVLLDFASVTTTRMLVPLLFLLPAGIFARQHSPSVFVAFSSHSNLPSRQNIERSLVSSPIDFVADYELCSNDAIVVVHQPGLVANDLYSLPLSSPLSQLFQSSPSKRFMSHSSPTFSSNELLASLGKTCDAERVHLEFGSEQYHPMYNTPGIKLISIELPEVAEEGRIRKDTMTSLMSTLSKDLRSLDGALSSYVVIIAGTVVMLPTKRDVDVDVQRPSPFFIPRVPSPASIHNRLAADNSTLPAGGILKRYQILTPGLLLTLIVTLLILFPIVFVGISALSSIKSPQRMEAPKGDRRG